jgi:excisionase family DNA binding protein
MEEQEWLTLRDAADALGISEVSARRWVKSGKLAAAQPGRKYLIPRSAVEELLSTKAGVFPESQRTPEQAERLEFLQHIRDLDRETLEKLSEDLAEEFVQVRSEWERAKETDAPEFGALSAQLENVGTKAFIASLQMRMGDNPHTARILEALVGAAS